MPELPEVETVRRVLQERYAGKIITAVALGKPTFYRAPPLAAIKILTGGSIASFKRRGKYLIAVIENRGEVIFHLGMSGRITVGGESPHVRFQMWIGTEAVRFAGQIPPEPRVRFLVKPLDLDVLLTMVREMLDPNSWSAGI